MPVLVPPLDKYTYIPLHFAAYPSKLIIKGCIDGKT